MIPKGYIYEDYFRYSEDPIIQKIWTERIEPYIDDPNYPTVYLNFASI